MELETILSGHTPHEPSLSTAILFCSKCKKPFTKEASYNRHFRYCSARTRVRPRSCQSCNAAKTKCTFEAPCSRCMKKGIECVYDSAAGAGGTPLKSSAVIQRTRARTSLVNDATNTDDGIWPTEYVASAPDSAANGIQLFELNPEKLSLDRDLTFDGLFAHEDSTFGIPQRPIDVSVLRFNSKLDQRLELSKDTWMRRGITLSVDTELTITKPNSNLLTIVHMERPHARHNADLVIQSIRAFPTMMLRRETFPWFIHPQMRMISDPTRTDLPEALSNCMSISQMFTSRTSETRPFIWRTIRDEYSRFTNQMYHMSKFELAFATQACMIYLIMCVIDNYDNRCGMELLLALNDLCNLFKELCGGLGSKSEISSPSPTWGDWIFAESRRRLTSLWFLLSCVVCLSTEKTCDVSQLYRSIPLPAPKALWEVPTEDTWKAEYESSQALQINGLVYLGDLIDVQQSSYTPANARKLDTWNAGIDNLGSLLNLVGTMV